MDTQWYKDAVIYQLHIKAFQDSDGDGVGDIVGLIQKLDYLVDLGVTALWLMPFYPSPLRDDGYDTGDYMDVDPRYGTLEQFQQLLDEAHRRGLRIITELVLNHTSDQHAWFQRARRSPVGSPERDYYVWSDDPGKFKDARIIFKDFEPSNWAWDAQAGAWYWHRFYAHQPDLNYDNPLVQEEAIRIMDHWLGMGVDGVRLDAVPYLYEREGTNCENLPETHAFLKKLRRHMDEKHPGRMLLAEANMWPEDALAYFGDGDECQMEFHFPLMPRMFMAVQMEDRFPIVDILDQTPPLPEGCQWAIFLRNHDELTLEMVTDEERDYMYRVYAEDPRARINLGIRRRLAPLLGNNRRKIELLNSLLFSMPGTPIIYYGDEIGMGDNIYLGDRDGVRTPMQWSSERNAGFSRTNPQKLYLPLIIDPDNHYESVNVENQRGNLSSLFWWTRRILAVRAQTQAFSRGSIEFLHPHNAKVLAYLRKHEDDVILVIANLSRFSQCTELDLSRFAGYVPEEMFGHTKFPAISAHTPFLVTLGPHNFYWLKLENQTAEVDSAGLEIPRIPLEPLWSPLLVRHLERNVLPQYLRKVRWFGGKRRRLRSVQMVREAQTTFAEARYFIVEASYGEGDPDRYVLPMVIHHPVPERPLENMPNVTIAEFTSGSLLVDAHALPEFRRGLLSVLAGEVRPGSDLVATGTGATLIEPSTPTRLKEVEQSNTSVAVGDSLWLKLYRKYEAGVHPEVEMMHYLQRSSRFKALPAFAGAISLRQQREEGILGVMMEYTRHQGDGWVFTLDALGRFFDRVLEQRGSEMEPTSVKDLIGEVYPRRVEQLARLTGEMHRILASAAKEDPAFTPEPFSLHYQRSLYQGMRSSSGRVLDALKRGINQLPAALQEQGRKLSESREAVFGVYAGLLHDEVTGQKIRIHGDLHLAQVLNTGDDFIFIDFEGEPTASLSERRLKRPALRDVASMLRSFDYAAATALQHETDEDRLFLQPWANEWSAAISQQFLRVYIETCQGEPFLPAGETGFQVLLQCLLLDKAIYELGYELNYRPTWVGIPLQAVGRLLAFDDQPKIEAGAQS